MSLDLSQLPLIQQQRILNGPALAPPPGIVPNFDNPPNQNHFGTLTNVMCLTTTVIVIGLRAYAKIFCVKQVHIEDYLAGGVLGTYIGCIYCNVWVASVGGLFVHQWDVRLKDLATILYILHIGSNLCAITIMVLKAAILREWIRIFVPYGSRNAFFWISAIVLTLHTLFHAAWIVSENLSCIPHEKIWDITISWGTCIDVKGLYVPAAAVNLGADIVILVLPQKAIWSLQMSRTSKIGVSLIFTIGFLACIAATFRLYSTVVFYRSDDVVYTQAGMYLWALAEMTCLFLVFCVPAAPKAFVGRGLRSKVKKILSCGSSWSTRAVRNDSRTTMRWPSALYRQCGENPSEFARVFPTTSTKGPVTEITVDSCHSTYQGTCGILCTTQFTAEVTIQDDLQHDGDEGEAYQKYQWSLMH
ncbi:hypothetical protein F5Y19DRAFT_473138 [Xylariaceae sp. FL1651]|nr:hypothetical protein F5Y19DRAFT_473138 [Xylariaceae sp. FL1651]